MEPVPIPWDCADGFFEAYWRRPEAYLDENVRRGISVWASVGPDAEQRQCTASVMTSPQAVGPNATATSSISTQQSLALACLSPEPATSGYDFAARSHGRSRPRLAPANSQLQTITPSQPCDLRLLPGVGAPVPGGRPNAEPGGGRASAPRSGAALIDGTGKEDSQEWEIVPLRVVFTVANRVPMRYRALALLTTFADLCWGAGRAPAGERGPGRLLGPCRAASAGSCRCWNCRWSRRRSPMSPASPPPGSSEPG
jgi:hypothetical protein